MPSSLLVYRIVLNLVHYDIHTKLLISSLHTDAEVASSYHTEFNGPAIGFDDDLFFVFGVSRSETRYFATRCQNLRSDRS